MTQEPEDLEQVRQRYRCSHPDQPDLIGAAVQTVQDPEQDKHYRGDSGRWRRSAPGVVTGFSDAHGLCFQVEHGAGTTAWYEPHEVQPWQSPDNPFSPPYTHNTITAAIDLWHEHAGDEELPEWLRISWEEYAAYVERSQLPQGGADMKKIMEVAARASRWELRDSENNSLEAISREYDEMFTARPAATDGGADQAPTPK